MKLEKITRNEYTKFLTNYKDSLFFQSIEWGNFKSKTGWNVELIGLKDKEHLKAVALLLSKKAPILNKKMYYCPRGFLIDYIDKELLKTFTTLLKKYLKENDALFLKINPYIEYQERDIDGNIVGQNNNKLIKHLKSLGYKHYGFYITFKEKKELEPRWLSVLDLENKTVDELLKDMRSTTRWLINKSQKNCITIREAKYEELDKFKKLMQHTAERREFEDRSLEYYQMMYKEMKNDNLYKLMFAEIDLLELKASLEKDIFHLKERLSNIENNPKKKNQVIEFNNQIKSLKKRIKQVESEISLYGEKPLIASGLYLSYGEQVVYLLGGSYKEFMGYGAQYLMQYEMIKFAKDNNFKKLNFYGIDGDFSESSKHYGLFDFKRGFNAKVVELVGEFDLPGNIFYYNLYKLMFSTYKVLKHTKLALRKKLK